MIDLLKNYITDGYIEIINIRGKNISQMLFFQNTFDKYKNECNWIAYFDIDEYLEFVDKNITINEFLSDNKFKRCQAIKIKWLMFNDNELIYYDNRLLQERFTKSYYYINDTRTVKTILRGKIYKNPWIDSAGPHEPSKIIKSCNSLGNFSPFNGGIIDPPIYKFCYIKHYSIKSTEEFAYKILKGFCGNVFNIEDRINYYFKVNNFNYKKLALL